MISMDTLTEITIVSVPLNASQSSWGVVTAVEAGIVVVKPN
jgi:hypothetical protein